MRTRRHGFTLIEILAALAIASFVTIGMVKLVLASMEDTRAQQAALYQSQVTQAASEYVKAHHAELVAPGAATETTPVRITLEQLRRDRLLSTSFQDTNAYGQTPCVLALQRTANKLDALVVTEGGNAIPEKDVAYVAAHGGIGAGYISNQSPLVAQGAFGSWRLTNNVLSNFLSTNCTGTPAGAGRLASAIFSGAESTADFVYRDAQSGRPELNSMTTPLHMRGQAVVTEGSSGPLCQAGSPPIGNGRIAVDNTGRVLSCQNGVWTRVGGSAYWKDPVATYTDLPATGNQVGDVRMVNALARAFTWNVNGWHALAVDQDGNLTVPGNLTVAGTTNTSTLGVTGNTSTGTLEVASTTSTGTLVLNQRAVYNDTCTTDGMLARDAAGKPLVCSSNVWQTFSDERTIIDPPAFNRGWRLTPADVPGGEGNIDIDLTQLPGSRPLWITGYTICSSDVGNVRVFAVVHVYDANGRWLGEAGGCGSRTEEGGSRVMMKGPVPLAKLPQNAALIRVQVEPGRADPDYLQVNLTIHNSQ